jgi:predicted nucleotidyltransferase
VRAIVAAHRAANPRVFGSVARGEDTEQSDVDILVDPNTRMRPFDIGGIQYGVSELLGVHVDIVTSGCFARKIQESRSWRGGADLNKTLRIFDYLQHIAAAIEKCLCGRP